MRRSAWTIVVTGGVLLAGAIVLSAGDAETLQSWADDRSVTTHSALDDRTATPHSWTDHRADSLHAWNEYPYVAHALGGSLEEDYHTNSRDAMIQSYEFGFRAFEADLVLLADGTALVAHDFHEPHYGLDKPFSEATWDEVKDLRYMGRWGQLDLASTVMRSTDLVQWMEDHPDVWMQLDPKADPELNLRILEAFTEEAPPEVLDRIIPMVGYQEELDGAYALWDWSGYLVALYRSALSVEEVQALLESNPRGGIFVMAERLDQSIRDLDVPVFVHATSGVDETVALVEDGLSAHVKNWIGDHFQLTRSGAP